MLQMSYPNEYIANLTHQFIDNCYVLENLAPLYKISSMSLLFAFFVWMVTMKYIRKDSVLYLHRTLAFIPALKSLEAFVQGADNRNCPWTDTLDASEAYLRMGKVTIVTFSYTFLHAVFFLLCKGWATANHDVDRD